MAGNVIIGFMPPYLQRVFPTHAALDSAYATVVGIAAFASAVIIGVICEVLPCLPLQSVSGTAVLRLLLLGCPVAPGHGIWRGVFL